MDKDNKLLNSRRKLINKLIYRLSSPIDKSYRITICYLIKRIVSFSIKTESTIDYYNLASKICNKILNNKIYSMDSIESLSDFISSRIPDLNIEFINYFSKSSKRCIKRFKKKLMANVRLWILNEELTK